jgi:hypothetical protein
MNLKKFMDLFKRNKYKNVGIYINKQNDLYMVPSGSSKILGGGTKEINIVNELNAPYTDEAIEELLFITFEQCFSKNPDELVNVTPIELYLNIKGYSSAVRNKKYINCFWNDEIGYEITPTFKVPYNGYRHQMDKKIVIGKKVKPGDLANAVKAAINKSKI